MLKTLKQQGGFWYLLECLCVAGFCFCICIVSASSLGPKILGEIGDVGSAIGSLNQSYTLIWLDIGHPNSLNAEGEPPMDDSGHADSDFTDTQDFCDQGTACGVRTCIAPIPEAPGGGG